MKFRFELTGKEIFVYFLVVILISIGLNLFNTYTIKSISNEKSSSISLIRGLYLIIALILYWIIMAICQYYICKKSIDSLFFNELKFNFNGKLDEFLWINISSLFLLIITLFLYTPKYIQRMVKYYVNNINYNDNDFDFYGKASNLFAIMLFTFLIPLILVTVIIIKFTAKLDINESILRFILIPIDFIIYTPFIFLFYKWIIQIKYLNYNIKLDAKFLKSVLFLLGQIVLSIITLSIYFPVALIKIYQYFLPKISISKDENIEFQIKTDFIIFDSWKYLWGQIILSIITLGIYIPWTYCNIFNYIITKIYIEKKVEFNQTGEITN
ncbi:MAG TPA: DUF898 family protein [Exilispira sp.]|nr:DUF898 family protein [Exilispira sp.]